VSRAPRDRQAERTAIEAAAGRLLAGTPLRATAGNLSATDLITESELGRWRVYEHRDLVERFQGQVKAADGVAESMRDLAAENQRLTVALANVTAALNAERERTALLLRALTEVSLELEHARQEPPANVTPLPPPGSRRARQAAARQPGPRSSSGR
jgi:hypothetical protein